MKDREFRALVVRFVREIGIEPEGRVRSVGFDLTRGVVVVTTDQGSFAAPASGLWSDYADNAALIRPRHPQLIKYPDDRARPAPDRAVQTRHQVALTDTSPWNILDQQSTTQRGHGRSSSSRHDGVHEDRSGPAIALPRFSPDSYT